MFYNFIPEVLWIGSLLTPLILRLGAGMVFFALAYRTWKGRYPSWVPIILAALQLLLGLCLVLGAFTQLAALWGIVIGSFVVASSKKLPLLYRDSIKLYILLGAVLLSLVCTGAGPLSMDSPL